MLIPNFSGLLISWYMLYNLWNINQVNCGLLWLSLFLDNKDTLASPTEVPISFVYPFYSTLFSLWMKYLAYFCMESWFLLVCLMSNQLLDDVVETPNDLKPGRSYTVGTLKTRIRSNQGLFILCKASLATGWIHFNVL